MIFAMFLVMQGSTNVLAQSQALMDQHTGQESDRHCELEVSESGWSHDAGHIGDCHDGKDLAQGLPTCEKQKVPYELQGYLLLRTRTGRH